MASAIQTARKSQKGRLVSSNHHLETYLTFDYLPAHQQGAIMLAVAGLHRAVLESAREFEPGDLFIESIHTGESIRVKFRQGRIFPGWEFPEDDLVILMPRWTAALFLTAGLLIGGAEVIDAVDKFARHFSLEDRQQQEQVVHKHFDLGNLGNPTSRIGQDARRNLLAFGAEITSPNISNVSVDGFLIRRRTDDDEEGPPTGQRTPASA